MRRDIKEQPRGDCGATRREHALLRVRCEKEARRAHEQRAAVGPELLVIGILSERPKVQSHVTTEDMGFDLVILADCTLGKWPGLFNSHAPRRDLHRGSPNSKGRVSD